MKKKRTSLQVRLRNRIIGCIFHSAAGYDGYHAISRRKGMPVTWHRFALSARRALILQDNA